MPKLNQVIAIEKGVKSRTSTEFTEMHHLSQKPELFTGFAKTYRPLDDAGEKYPPENKRVQYAANSMLTRAGHILSELWDVTAQKDGANTRAKADVVVDNNALLENVPVPLLLFLEKQLTDLRTFIDKMPTLDENDMWTADPVTGLHKTEPISTHRTKKEQEPIVLYDATKEHAAQTQLITKDVLVGYWETVKQSGALPKPRKDLLLDRVERVIRAVKFAREEANGIEAEGAKVGSKIFEYILRD